MKKTTPIYDDSLEVLLTDMLCKLDENPIVNINQIGSSAYKGHLLADGEDGFQKFIHMSLYLKFIEYFDNYKVRCINAYAVKTNFIPVVKRLLSQYNEAIDSLYSSNVREEWSRYFDNTRIYGTEENLKKQAFQFFYNASAAQIFYLGKLADKMKEYIAEFDTVIPKPEPEYYFTIRSEFASQRHNILYDIHKNLKAMKYVDCTAEVNEGYPLINDLGISLRPSNVSAGSISHFGIASPVIYVSTFFKAILPSCSGPGLLGNIACSAPILIPLNCILKSLLKARKRIVSQIFTF